MWVSIEGSHLSFRGAILFNDLGPLRTKYYLSANCFCHLVDMGERGILGLDLLWQTSPFSNANCHCVWVPYPKLHNIPESQLLRGDRS